MTQTRLRRLGIAMTAALVLASLAAAQTPATKSSSAAPAGPSLYKRLGGYDAIAAVCDDFIGRLISDTRFTRFFAGFSSDSKARIRQHIVDQLCNATGGPCVYMGRTMKQSHAGLGITEEDWNAAVAHLVASLDKFKVPEKEKGELAAILATVKGDIVEKK